MALGSGFTPAMLCPVNTVGHKLNCGGVDRINGSFEPLGQPGIFVITPEVRMLVLDMGQHFPEEGFGHAWISHTVGM